ncbi:acid protease [Gyrodon lividus]|nr:acid protease [Gyrodon lividus]
MRFILATVITALPFFVAGAPQPAKQRGKAIPLSKLSSPDQSVNFEALNSHIASTTAKILRGFDNFEKNIGASHPFPVKGAWKRDSGGLPLESLPDAFNRWFGTISIGTPPRNFAVLFDTGSSDIILPGALCDDTCDGHAFYDPEASLSSIDLDRPFRAWFGSSDGAFGYQYIDNVTVAGLTATHQTLGAAMRYSQGLQIGRFAGDGLLGMAFQSLSTFGQSPFFQTLVTEGQTDEPVFAFNLGAYGAELYLGGTNPDMYTGDFTWVPVIRQAYWEVNIDNVVGNGQNVLTSVAGIIDTGSFFVRGPPSDVAALYAVIGGTPFPSRPGYYSFPCDAVPSVGFTFGGRYFPIPAESLNIGFDRNNPSQCVGAIIAGIYGTWVVGTTFLDSVYIAFDVGNVRVGFATLAAV